MTSQALDLASRSEIEQLITAFFFCLDAGAIEEVADMFNEDAWLDMGVAGRPKVQGPGGVRTMFSTRPENRAVRHHWSNLHVQSVGEEVHAIIQFTTYTGTADRVAPPVAVTIGDVSLQLRRGPDDDKWRFAQMDRVVVFAPS